MREAPSRKLSLAAKRRTYQPRESFAFQTEPTNEVRKMFVPEGDDKVTSTERRGRKAEFSSR